MGTDDVESVYFQNKYSVLTRTSGEKGGDVDTLLNSSTRNLEVISSSDSDDDDQDESAKSSAAMEF